LQSVTGIFLSQSKAEHAVQTLLATGIPADKITLLTPGETPQELKSVPLDEAEQPGMGKAVGAVVGAAGGFSTGALLAAIIPGVGPVTAAGLLGGAILAAAGGMVGAATGKALENSTTQGIPEDEIFVYEDALRKGRTVVLVLAQDEQAAVPVRALLRSEGAEAIDAARQQWWIGLRSAESEHYRASSTRSFQDDEKFYRLGFEAALHARTRCKEFDQVSAEMTSRLEDLQRQYPGVDLEEAFTRGYRRGREYYQRLCDQSKAA
jgi:hypothetical protein